MAHRRSADPVLADLAEEIDEHPSAVVRSGQWAARLLAGRGWPVRRRERHAGNGVAPTTRARDVRPKHPGTTGHRRGARRACRRGHDLGWRVWNGVASGPAVVSADGTRAGRVPRGRIGPFQDRHLAFQLPDALLGLWRLVLSALRCPGPVADRCRSTPACAKRRSSGR